MDEYPNVVGRCVYCNQAVAYPYKSAENIDRRTVMHVESPGNYYAYCEYPRHTGTKADLERPQVAI